MTAEYAKPLPLRTEENAPYINGLKEKQVRLQRCGGCGRFRYPPSQFCPSCLSDEAEWQGVSGRGTVYSFIIVHQLYHPSFREDIPYSVAVVELDEGPRLTANIVGCANDDLRIGMPVQADFFQAAPDAVILKFRPA